MSKNCTCGRPKNCQGGHLPQFPTFHALPFYQLHPAWLAQAAPPFGYQGAWSGYPPWLAHSSYGMAPWGSMLPPANMPPGQYAGYHPWAAQANPAPQANHQCQQNPGAANPASSASEMNNNNVNFTPASASPEQVPQAAPPDTNSFDWLGSTAAFSEIEHIVPLEEITPRSTSTANDSTPAK